jgi:DNA-binding transcriptional regulator LsrR (DeoR family)
MSCPQHRIVSLLGNMMADGSATPYNATIRMADRVGAQHYPYPLPVLARDRQELRLLQGQEAVRHTLELCSHADLTFVGIGNMGRSAPLYVDGFISDEEMANLEAAGATGEITSWIYDANGVQIDTDFNSRVASAPLPEASNRDVVAVAVGSAKVAAIKAAIAGSLINGLITNESTAERLLALNFS